MATRTEEFTLALQAGSDNARAVGRTEYWAQAGEDGVLEAIFEWIGTTNKYCVDIGAGDGWNLSNVRRLLQQGWTGLLIDGSGPHDGVVQAMVSYANVWSVLTKHAVPAEFDLLSLDIDGQDYWVLAEILVNRKPRVIVCEFNAAKKGSVTVPKNSAFAHDGTTYYGASFDAFRGLCERRGYTLVRNHHDVNLFFVLSSEIEGITPKVTYKQRNYHRPDTKRREWVRV